MDYRDNYLSALYLYILFTELLIACQDGILYSKDIYLLDVDNFRDYRDNYFKIKDATRQQK